MLTEREVELILSSVWCTIPAEWGYRLRSNSYLRVLDLSHPGTYGIHISYSILDGTLLYVLFTLPEDYDTSTLETPREDLVKDVYTEDNAIKVVFYRKGLDNVRSV